MPYNYEIIQEIQDVPNNVWEYEWFLKRYIKQQSIHYVPKIKFDGYLTECFKV